ncbi:unnamed protein product [Protopolystoma xenopodis]|uniref:EGF-like domain-containing protein n=1 Tax=Protopolystoma xenopodis TaxID=117903 RepID=A0A3S5A036_9PLAT|nr:unnamed protein product [Protopolystoma xenopodis]
MSFSRPSHPLICSHLFTLPPPPNRRIRCSCPDGRPCHHETGACSCQAGLTGAKCEIACVQGRYGRDCQETCDCQRQDARLLCDPLDGTCRCRPGWTGRGWIAGRVECAGRLLPCS